MSTPEYDDQNVFAKILHGELPCAKIFEDEATLAFMDAMPQGEGHALVVPKVRARTLLDVAPDTLSKLIAQVQRVGAAAKEAFAADGLTLFQFSEAAGGQTVFHLHFHVVPRFAGVPLRPHQGGSPGGMADGAVLKAHAARIAAALRD